MRWFNYGNGTCNAGRASNEPVAIRKRLNLKTGDKICFIEQDGRVRIENAAVYAFEKIQNDFTGEADSLGLNNIDDAVDLVKEVRHERKKNNPARNF